MTFFVVLSVGLAIVGVGTAILALVRLSGVIRRPTSLVSAFTRDLRSLEEEQAHLGDRLKDYEDDDSPGAEVESSRLREEMADGERSMEVLRQRRDAARSDPSSELEDWEAAHPLEYRRGMATAVCAGLWLFLSFAVLQLGGAIQIL
ncbi:MAG: hypothetical protein ACYSX0_13085 [Planctomycetota bacterium]|jgi:hypothetical protein